MRSSCGLMLVLGVLVFASLGSAADDPSKAKKKKGYADEYEVPLVMPEMAAGLKLTPEQQAQLKEFDGKNQEAVAKARKDHAKAEEDLKAAQALVKKAQEELKAPTLGLDKLRQDSLAKFIAQLTPAQRQAYEDIRAGKAPQ